MIAVEDDGNVHFEMCSSGVDMLPAWYTVQRLQLLLS